ncbi:MULTISPECIES: hypothetical protein [Niastella]|uniref:MoxR-vWA-beta-propeller ternary system domain-containing protein n=1 Tax=Niastella soli TaxID=2821487 RepID=A0ABS3YQ11_9BACT|nr:hypothetical protein [Niastella soli]MBO9199331.1 hypothetical protein [Niastella soli]
MEKKGVIDFQLVELDVSKTTTGDLLEQLDENAKTTGLAQLTKRLLAALDIPMHAHGSSDHLRRELPSNPEKQRILLVDTTLKMWGLPRVFAMSAALACALNNKSEARVASYTLSGADFKEIDLTTREGVVRSLEQLDAVLHCGRGLSRFMDQQAMRDEDEVFLITEEEITHGELFQSILASLKKPVNFLITVNRNGELRFYEYIKGHKKQLSEARFDLQELLFHITSPKEGKSDGKTRNVLSAPAFMQCLPSPLYLPASKIKFNPDCFFEMKNEHLICVTMDQRVLYWTSRKRGAREIIENLEYGQICFGTAGDSTLYILVYTGGQKNMRLYKVNLETNTVANTKLQLPVSGLAEMVFGDGYFYIKADNELFGIDAATGKAYQGKDQMGVFDLMLQRKEKAFTNASLNYYKKIVSDGYTTINTVKSVYVSADGELGLDDRLINLEMWSRTIIIHKEKSKTNCEFKAEEKEAPGIGLPNTSLKFSRFVWADGSEALVDSRGFLHLKSSDSSIPEITITMIIGKPVAFWIENGEVGGPAYFIGEANRHCQDVPWFYENYIQRFIDRIITHENIPKRTTAQSSGQLGKRSTGFNLGELAQKAIEEKDFKKAAYIYANLLGDFTTAADVLRGKDFREAAVLYNEHLKRLSMAAINYEKGGLLREAIEIYTELNQHEKAGDLYRELGQEEPALNCYEKCVVAAAAKKDYLEEARIIFEKIADLPRAKKVLLSGWQDIRQPEACLEKYFDLVADENKEQLPAAVKTFYANDQVAKKETLFLIVLNRINQKHKTAELENACQHIAYEIVSAKVSAIIPDTVLVLRNFVPGDQLLRPDLYHYFMNAFKKAPSKKTAPEKWQLKTGVRWFKTLVWHNQLLAWGEHAKGLFLARITWEGHVEYFTFDANAEINTSMLALTDENTNQILLYGFDGSLKGKWLPKNNHFQEELIVSKPGFIPSGAIGIGFRDKDIAVLSLENEAFILRYFTMEGHVKASYPCTFTHGPFDLRLLPAKPVLMKWSGNSFYLAGGNVVLRIAGDGLIDVICQSPFPIKKFAVHESQETAIEVVYAYGDQVTIHVDDTVNPYLVEGIFVNDMTFLPDDFLVLGCQWEVHVIKGTNTSWDLYWKIETKNKVIAVFPGPTRDQLGILELNGKITLHKFRE